MPNFEKPTTPEEQSEQLSAPEQNNVPEQGPENELSPESLQKKFARQNEETREIIERVDESLYNVDKLDDEEPEVTEGINEKTSGLLGKFGKSKALRAVAMLTALVLPAEAYGGTLDKINKVANSDITVTRNGRLKPQTMHGDAHLNSILQSLRGTQNAHEQALLKNLKSGGVEFGTSHIDKHDIKLMRLHNMGGEYPTNSLYSTQQKMLRNRERLNNVHIGKIYSNDQSLNVKFQSYNNVDRNDIYADPTSDVSIGSIDVNNK